MSDAFNMKYEKELIEDWAKDIYEELLDYADKRSLEPYFVIEEFIKTFSSLSKNM